MTIDHQGKEGSGIYRVTLTLNNGKREIHRHYDPDIIHLRRLVDKCEIKSFSLSLDTIAEKYP